MQMVGGSMCPARLSSVPATPSSIEVWIAEAGIAGGGSRLTLANGMAVSAGGHSYRFNSSDGLFGSGTSAGVAMAIIGTIAISVDGQADQITFDFAGCSQQSTLPTTVVARVSAASDVASQTVARTYAVTMTGATYQFTDMQSPAGCGSGVDLLGITF